jgi:hypothetical protein
MSVSKEEHERLASDVTRMRQMAERIEKEAKQAGIDTGDTKELIDLKVKMERVDTHMRRLEDAADVAREHVAAGLRQAIEDLESALKRARRPGDDAKGGGVSK